MILLAPPEAASEDGSVASLATTASLSTRVANLALGSHDRTRARELIDWAPAECEEEEEQACSQGDGSQTEEEEEVQCITEEELLRLLDNDAPPMQVVVTLRVP